MAPGELNSAGVIGLPGAVHEQPPPSAPGGGIQARPRQRAEVAQQEDRRDGQRYRRGDQAATDHGPLHELARLGAFVEGFLEGVPLLRSRPHRVPLLGQLDVGHEVPDPDHGTGTQQQEDQRHRGPERKVRVQRVVDRAHADRCVGDQETEAGQHGEQEARDNDPLGLLGPGQIRRVGGHLRRRLLDAIAAIAGIAGVGKKRPGGRGRRRADDPARGSVTFRRDRAFRRAAALGAGQVLGPALLAGVSGAGLSWGAVTHAPSRASQ